MPWRIVEICMRRFATLWRMLAASASAPANRSEMDDRQLGLQLIVHPLFDKPALHLCPLQLVPARPASHSLESRLDALDDLCLHRVLRALVSKGGYRSLIRLEMTCRRFR